MASTTNINSTKLFHTYENVGHEDVQTGGVVGPSNNCSTNIIENNLVIQPSTASQPLGSSETNGSNKNAIESALSVINAGDTMNDTQITSQLPQMAVLSTASTDLGGTTCMIASRASGSNLVTKLITFPAQSPMDSLKEWSVQTFKCTKQLINEKRGLCPVTSDIHVQNDIEMLRDNRDKLVKMLQNGKQMTNRYTKLVQSQRELHALMNEMSLRCFASYSLSSNMNHLNNNSNNNNNNISIINNQNHKSQSISSKQVIANFSSLANNLTSSTTTTTTTANSTSNTSPKHHQHLNHQRQNNQLLATTRSQHNSHGDYFEDFLPVLNHMRVANTNLVEDFKRNAMALNVAIKNGEKLIAALDCYCANLSTLIDKTIADTLATVRQFELARLEYDAERNSLTNAFLSAGTKASGATPASVQSATGVTAAYSSDRLELARARYEQLRGDVQIKMKFLEENTSKVMHKQLILFNGAFASYTSGNTAALDSTLKQFCIKDGSTMMRSV